MSEISSKSNSSNSSSQSQEKLRQMELAISRILRVGVVISASIIIFGSILFIVTGKSGYGADKSVANQGVSIYTHYQGEQNANLYFPTKAGDIVAGVLALKSFGIIAFGVFVLILTPIVRVGVSALTFALERDWLYVVFTLIVLAVLLISFFLGKAGG